VPRRLGGSNGYFAAAVPELYQKETINMACDEKNYWYTAQPYKGQGTYGIRKSRGFTGLDRGTYYYRGAKWTGPTNLIGRPDLAEARRRERVLTGA
jgi:hypothetical protein